MEYLFECSQQSLVALPAFGRAQLKFQNAADSRLEAVVALPAFGRAQSKFVTVMSIAECFGGVALPAFGRAQLKYELDVLRQDAAGCCTSRLWAGSIEIAPIAATRPGC